MSGTYAEGAGDACAPPTGTSNEELPIRLKRPRFRERRFTNGRCRSFSGEKSDDLFVLSVQKSGNEARSFILSVEWRR